MHIICFLILMILNQNKVLISDAKPFLSKINQLNSIEEFDNIVDWTRESLENIRNDKKENKNFKETTPTGKSKLKQRSVSSLSTAESNDFSINEFDENPQAISEDQKILKSFFLPSDLKNRKRSDEEFRDVMEYADNVNEFGERIGKFYKRMRNKMSGKKCENCINKLDENVPSQLYDSRNDYSTKTKYIPSFKRSVPMCLLNERYGSEYYRPMTGEPVFQPIMMNDFSSYLSPAFSDGAALYEVRWMENSPVASSKLRTRREVFFDDRTHSIMDGKEADLTNKAPSIQQELMDIVSSMKTELLRKHNLTFIPILFVPHCELHNTPETLPIGQATFRNTDGRYEVPCQGKMNEFALNAMDHFSMVFMTNNTINLFVPIKGLQGTSCACYSENNFPLEGNVIGILKDYLQKSTNLFDLSAIPPDDERPDICSSKTKENMVPGILLYPLHYSISSLRYSGNTSNLNCGNNQIFSRPLRYFYVNTRTIGSAKSKRSISIKGDEGNERALTSEEKRLDDEENEAELENGIGMNLNVEKRDSDATDFDINESVSEQLKKKDSHLDNETNDMIHNEQLLESSHFAANGTTETTTCLTDALITKSMELLSKTKDTFSEDADSISTPVGEDVSTEIEADGRSELTEESKIEEQSSNEFTLDNSITDESDETAQTKTNSSDSDDEDCSISCDDSTTDICQEESVSEPNSEYVEKVADLEGEVHQKSREKQSVNRKTKDFSRKFKKSSFKSKRKQKNIRNRRYLRGRRDVKDIADTSIINKQGLEIVKNVIPKEEILKVTQKVTLRPIIQGEEFENVNQVLFTSRTNKETDTENPKSKTDKKVGIAVTPECGDVTPTTELPAALSEYTESNIMDENDEFMTDTLSRLLRDVSLVNEVQNILEGIEDTGRVIRQAVKKKSRRRMHNFKGRKLFSAGDKEKLSESDDKNEKNTIPSNSRIGVETKSNSVLLKVLNRKLFSVESSLEREINVEQLSGIHGNPSRNRKRWKHSTNNWVEWLPNFEPFLVPNYQNYQF